MDRRRLLQFAGATAVFPSIATAKTVFAPPQTDTPIPQPIPVPTPRPQALQLTPIRLNPDQIFRTTVCLRPFRAAGPRIETERFGDFLVRKNIVSSKALPLELIA